MSSGASGRRPGHRVLVVGSGWAGLAAALAAREGHTDVVLLDGGVGASALGPGALDDVSWEARELAARASGAALVAPLEGPEGGVGTDLRWLVEQAGEEAFVAPPGGEPLPILATMGGRLRSTRARDAALLDLGALPAGARVMVPRVDRAGWDADALVRLWSADPHARGVAFEAADVDVLRYDDERRIADADFASRHDEPGRRAWLGERLREAIARRGEQVHAVMLGPWLGVAAARASSVSEAAGVTVGEALAPLAATAGMRFEAVRKRLLEGAGVRVLHLRATAITVEGGRARVAVGGADPLHADAVVLAVGGLAGGGLVYSPPEHGAGWEGAEVVSAPVQMSVACGARVEMSGEAGPGSSMFGPALDETAWPIGPTPGALEVAGVREDQLAGVWSGLFAAGEVIARRARTVGEAVASGRRAGRAAAAR